MSALQVSDYTVPLGEGVQLSVRHLRQPDSSSRPRRTLVLLHESLGSIALWKGFPERLAQVTGADVLMYDRRGYGGSSDAPLPRPDDYLEQEGAVWLPRLLEALELENVVLFGHSDGASVALIGAAAMPARTRGLICIAAHTFVDHLTVSGINEAVQRYHSTDLPERLARHHGDRTDRLFNAWHETWLRESFIQSMDFTDWLAAIECPALIMQGEQDEYGVPEQVSAIVEGIGARATGTFLPDSGHFPHFEQPDRLLNLISDFVTRLPTGEPPG